MTEAPLTADEYTTLRSRVAERLAEQWTADGYTAPNHVVYPWQWLWDSCFHSLIWAELGAPERALSELTLALSTQDESGFVPHMNYLKTPDFHAAFWGRRGASSITQPPMYGHTLAALAARGLALPDELVDRARRGLLFLLRQRGRDLETGLVLIVHPWETGADDSPRWDDLCPGGYETGRWKERKGELVASISRSRTGAPIANGLCAVAPAGFNALVAFNALELLALVADDTLEREALELVERLDARWDGALGSWRDAGITQHGSGRVRTLDALLPALVTSRAGARDRVFADLVHGSAFGAPFGPTGVHRDEPSFDPSLYWRGPAWPQLNYLLWVAARRGGVASTSSIALMTARAALDSGFAEYWNPDTGRGLGAIPQAWTGLALLMAGQR